MLVFFCVCFKRERCGYYSYMIVIHRFLWPCIYMFNEMGNNPVFYINVWRLVSLSHCDLGLVKLFGIKIDQSHRYVFDNRWGPIVEQGSLKNRQRLYLSEQASFIAHNYCFSAWYFSAFPLYFTLISKKFYHITTILSEYSLSSMKKVIFG